MGFTRHLRKRWRSPTIWKRAQATALVSNEIELEQLHVLVGLTVYSPLRQPHLGAHHPSHRFPKAGRREVSCPTDADDDYFTSAQGGGKVGRRAVVRDEGNYESTAGRLPSTGN